MRVSLFVTCLVDQVRPSVDVATVRLLRRLGCEVRFNPQQTCCGQPAYTTGNRDEGRAIAQRTISLLESEASDWIVIPSGSCAAMFQHYRSLMEDDRWRDRATAMVRKTRELSVFVVNELGITDVNARFNGRITWHDGCHGLRDLGIRNEPRELLGKVTGATLVDLEHHDACCGFGGIFSVSYPGISTAMADRKLDEIEKQDIGVVVSGDVGCLMQLSDRLEKRGSTVLTMHLAELLTHTT